MISCGNGFVVAAAATLIAGCGGSQPPIGAPNVMPQSRAIVTHAQRGGSYKTAPPLLYVTDIDANYPNVRVYRAKTKYPAPLATISDGVDGAFGNCIDGHGTLYVTTEPSSGPGWISVYPLGKTTPSRTITDGISTPGFCTIDANGNLWVSNIGGRNVSEYLRGAGKPHTIITSGLYYPIGIAIDHSGTLYVGNGFGASQQNVEVYSAGSKLPSRTITDGITSPCGITVDANGTLYVTNEFQENVEEYRSGQNDPFQTITKAMNGPVGVAVNKEGDLYVANLGGPYVSEFAPGSLKPLKRQISKGLYNPAGIAYYPALLP